MKVQQSFCLGLLRILILLILFAELLCPMIGGHAHSATFGTGEYILFERGGNAYRMNADGNGVRLIVKLAEQPYCSSTGDGIVFLRLGRDPTGKDLFWTDPLGTSVQRLTRGLFVTGSPSVSSRGIVAFVSGYSGALALYTLRVTDGIAVQHGNGFAEVRSVQWSPDGKYLGFVATREKGLDRKWAYSVLDYDSGIIKQIAETGYFSPSLSWSPDGASVALFRNGLEVVDMKTSSNRLLPRPMGLLHDVTWSPNGQYLALVQNDEQCGRFTGSIYVVRLSDNTEKKVSNPSNRWFSCRDYHSPRWSPDGTRMIFLAFRPRGDMAFIPFTKYIWDNIYIVNRDGTGQTNLSGNEDVRDEHPMWCKESSKN